jgi:hypothetical protein
MPCMENPIAKGAKATLNTSGGMITGMTLNSGITNYSINSGAFTVMSNAHVSIGGQLAGAAGVSGPCSSTPPRPPANWRQIECPNDHYCEDVYENPLGGRAVHVSSLTLSNGAARHHWKIFCALYPKINYLLIGVSHTEVGNSTVVSNVAFPNPADGLVFEAWLEDYAKPFGDRDNLYRHRYPPLPKRTPPLTAMNLAVAGDDTDMSLWLAKSCTAPYYVAGRLILFENDEDAVAYTLKFE